MSTSSNNNITFLPSEAEKTPDLKKLFGDVNKLIANYLEEHPEANDKSIRRFVAGDVCQEDLAELNASFGLPKPPKATTWSMFLKEQLSNKRKFIDMSEISEEYNAMKQDRTEEFVQLEVRCQQEKQKMLEKQKEENDSPTIRNEFYRKDLSDLLKFCDVMYENYKTSIIVYGATDTMHFRHYRPFRHANSKLAEQAEKTILKSTDQKDLQYILNDTITIFGEKSLFFKEGNTFPSLRIDNSTKKDGFLRPFNEQALLAWKDAGSDMQDAKRVPWAKVLSNTDEYVITGWPESIKKPINKNKFEPYTLTKEELKQLTQLFQEKKIRFVRNVIPSTRPE